MTLWMMLGWVMVAIPFTFGLWRISESFGWMWALHLTSFLIVLSLFTAWCFGAALLISRVLP